MKSTASKSSTIKLLLICCIIVFYASCKKEQQNGGLNPDITINPSTGLVGSLVTITGNGFSTDPTQDIVTFNGKKAEVVSVSATQLIVVVPDSTTSGPVAVNVMGKEAKGPLFTFQGGLGISSISPQTGPAGTTLTINGTGFLADSSKNSSLAGIVPNVFINGQAVPLISSSATKLTVQVPQGASSGPVTVSLSTLKATGPNFYFSGINSISPLSGNAGTKITINGGFGPDITKVSVSINGVPATIKSINLGQAVVTVPKGSGSGPVNITASGQTIPGSGSVFTYVSPPTISSISPTSGPVGTPVTIAGTVFSSNPPEDVVTFNGVAAPVSQASGSQLNVTVPAGSSTGPIIVNVNGQSVKGQVFKVQSLGVFSESPLIGLPGAIVTLTGVGFNPAAAKNQVFFNGTAGVVSSATSTQLVVKAPSSFSTGPISVSTGGLSAIGPIFTLQVPGVTTIAGGTLNPNQFVQPTGIAVDAAGNVYVADQRLNNIQKISPNGMVTNFAGDPNGNSGLVDGQGASARFRNPTELAIDPQGNLYVADNQNSAVRKITPDGTVSTFATTADPIPGVALDGSGNVYFTNTNNNVYEFSQSRSPVNTFSPPSRLPGFTFAIAIDASGNIYLTNGYGLLYENYNLITTFSNGGHFYLAFDNSGNLIISPPSTNAIYSFNPNAGFAQTLLTGGGGSGQPGYQDGPLSTALFNTIQGVAVDSNGNIYVVDQGNLAIRKIVLP